MNVTEIGKKSVCIVRFRQPIDADHPGYQQYAKIVGMPKLTPAEWLEAVQPPGPGKYFQVTVDPGKFSSTGNNLRFGETAGDEIVGWQPTVWMDVVEILGEWEDENIPPTLHYRAVPGVTAEVNTR